MLSGLWTKYTVRKHNIQVSLINVLQFVTHLVKRHRVEIRTSSTSNGIMVYRQLLYRRIIYFVVEL